MLTVLTLGLYRFWMKTRLRRWYWSSARVGGHPLEYVGDPFEKLLGFLIAVVILAFYIGVVNLLLMFVSFSLFQGNFAAYLLSFVGVIPLWFYAQYRARRYVLARTRWRGLRFGLEPGAWGYAGRALLYWLLVIVTAGLLLPLMVFRLEKYKADRTHWGTARMAQGGRWTMLYASMKPLFVALAFAIGAVVAGATENTGMAVGLGLLAGLIGTYGLFFFKVDSLKRLTETKRLAGARLALDPSASRVMGIYLLGYVLTFLVILIPGALLGVAMLGVQSAETLSELGLDGLGFLEGQSRYVLLGLSVALYFSIFLLWSALTHAFVTMPETRHYVSRLSLHEAQRLDHVAQRPRDEAEQAEGFAEALDVGASI